MTKMYTFDCGCSYPILRELPGYSMPLLDFRYADIKPCARVWDIYRDGLIGGVFQSDSNVGRKYAKEMRPESIEHLSALGAAVRPGTLGATDETGKNLCQKLCDRKNNREATVVEFPAVGHILQKTYDILLYQEQAIAIAQEICGFSPSEADTLRRGTAKKDAHLLLSLENMFVEGATKVNKVSKDDATKIFTQIKKSARYSFNKCLHPKTTVELPNNVHRQIRNLEIGDMVRIPNFDSKEKKYSKVLNIFNQGKQQLYFFHVGPKIIECTLNHKFLCVDRFDYDYNIAKKTLLSVSEIIANYPKYKIITDKGIFYPYRLDLSDDYWNTYDIEIEDENHIFFADGLACSNSHATLYAIRSYNDAYLKTHAPLQFYTAKLKSPRKGFDSDDRADLIYEAKLLNINTKLPDVRDMRPVFYTDGKFIYFGITDINGFGNAAYQELLTVYQESELVEEGEAKGQKRLLSNFFEFAVNSALKLSESKTCLLIEAGALDWTGMARSAMLEEFKLLSQLTKTEKEKLGRYIQAEKIGVFNVNNKI